MLAAVVSVGVVWANRAGDAVSATTQPSAVPGVAANPQQLESPAPDQPSDPATQEPTPTPAGAQRDASVTAFYEKYFSAINNGDYDTVWRMLSPRLRGSSPTALGKGFATTQDSNIEVVSLSPKSKGWVLAHVTFTSTQDAANGPNGDTCDNWDLEYLLAPVGDSWQIQKVSGAGGGPTHTRC